MVGGGDSNYQDIMQISVQIGHTGTALGNIIASHGIFVRLAGGYLDCIS